MVQPFPGHGAFQHALEPDKAGNPYHLKGGRQDGIAGQEVVGYPIAVIQVNPLALDNPTLVQVLPVVHLQDNMVVKTQVVGGGVNPLRSVRFYR